MSITHDGNGGVAARSFFFRKKGPTASEVRSGRELGPPDLHSTTFRAAPANRDVLGMHHMRSSSRPRRFGSRDVFRMALMRETRSRGGDPAII